MKRTGSIGSPRATGRDENAQPSHGPLGPGAACSIASSNVRGSGSRPTPCSPREARGALLGLDHR